MPAEAGIYTIRNIQSGRQYIGSSINLRKRIDSHMRDLSLGCHANHALQSDFLNLGADQFEVKILDRAVSPSNLAAMEADRIASLLRSGAALYNMTEDGQGTRRHSLGNKNSEPISDRLERRSAEAEKRKTYEILEKKRKAVIDEFNLKSATLIPQINFWTCFVAIFISALIVFPILIPRISDGSLFILSAILAFVISPFIRIHFQEKAKTSSEYQRLVKQRDEQLSEIDNEFRKIRDL